MENWEEGDDQEDKKEENKEEGLSKGKEALMNKHLIRSNRQLQSCPCIRINVRWNSCSENSNTRAGEDRLFSSSLTINDDVNFVGIEAERSTTVVKDKGVNVVGKWWSERQRTSSKGAHFSESSISY